MAPATGPGVARVGHTDLGIVQEVVGSHGEGLAGEIHLVSSLTVALPSPGPLPINTIDGLGVLELGSE